MTYVSDLIRRKRAVAVDWKEHPIEVMAHLDRLAGAAWRKDPARWQFTEALDLDRLVVADFLARVAGPLAEAGLAILSFDLDSDEAIFALTRVEKAPPAIAEAQKARAKVERVVAKALPKTKPPKASRAREDADTALAELAKKQLAITTVDGAHLAGFEIFYATRFVIAAGAPADEVRRLFHLTVDNHLATWDALCFRQHGPHVDGELLGAALLVGRGGELVRAMAHLYSLGQSSKTTLYTSFLGRDVPPTWKRGETVVLDRLLAAPAARLDAALAKYLASEWSTWARGMKGSRASFLAMGLAARAGTALVVPAALEAYLARELLPAPAEPKRPRLATRLPKAPRLPQAMGPARDASRPSEAALAVATSLAAWVTDAIVYARVERSGMYLRAVPETAVDVATVLYAAGAAIGAVKAWLGFAVDLEIARCEAPSVEDSLGWVHSLRDVAGAAVLLDRGNELAAAWRAARVPVGDPTGVLPSTIAWLEDKPAPRVTTSTLRLPKAIVEVLLAREAVAIGAFLRVPTAVPRETVVPWTGPFSAFVTALGKPLASVPSSIATASMEELCGRVPSAPSSLTWGKPRSKLPVVDLRSMAVTAERRIDVGEPSSDAADDCLFLARLVWALGAPLSEIAKWLSRCVDFAKSAPYRDMTSEHVGAARLVGRHGDLAAALVPHADCSPPEVELVKTLADYARGGKVRPALPILKQRYFFDEYARAMIAARANDAAAVRKALARAPWQHRLEWNRGDMRKRPPYWSFFVIGIAADVGLSALPRSALALVEPELVGAARDGKMNMALESGPPTGKA